MQRGGQRAQRDGGEVPVLGRRRPARHLHHLRQVVHYGRIAHHLAPIRFGDITVDIEKWRAKRHYLIAVRLLQTRQFVEQEYDIDPR